ncbi:MAG: hypothetical protein IMW98_04760 [Firmicutes bacterium]|nr:hypothetical protein [Bacillota bacterium]
MMRRVRRAGPPGGRANAGALARGAARALAAALLAAALFASGCGGLTGPRWDRAIAGAREVAQLLAEGRYSEAKSVWLPVDQVIHAAYPQVDRVDPDLAGRLWYHMGLVELGFLKGDWAEARKGAAALPELLTQARRALQQGGGGG